jgi:hypothetical protein
MTGHRSKLKAEEVWRVVFIHPALPKLYYCNVSGGWQEDPLEAYSLRKALKLGKHLASDPALSKWVRVESVD